MRPPQFRSDEERQGYLTGMQNSLGTAIDYLGRPQNAVAGMLNFDQDVPTSERFYRGLTGREDYDYSENPYVNVPMEILLDPLSYSPAGLLKAGKMTTLGLGGQGTESAGRTMSGISNYIKDWYGKAKDDPITPLEVTLGKLLLKAPTPSGKNMRSRVERMAPANAEKAYANIGAKVFGMLDHVKNSAIPGILDEFNPMARALWKKYGVSRQGQRIVSKLLEKMDKKSNAVAAGKLDRAEAKAVAQVIHNSHILEQSRKSGGKTAAAVESIRNKAFVEPYTSFVPGTFSNMFQKHSGFKNGQKIPITDVEANVMEAHIIDKWDAAPDIVVMKTSSTQAGNHINDLISEKNINISLIKDTFKGKQSFNNVQELKTALEKSQVAINSKKGKDVAGKKVFILDQYTDPNNPLYDPTGIWVYNGAAGSAIVEGGSNFLLKIKPNGDFVTVFSDRYDFLENVPIIKKANQQLDTLIATNSPVHGNVNNFNKKGMDKDKYTTVTSKIAGTADSLTYKENLEDYANLAPTTQEIAEETLDLLTKLTGVSSGMLFSGQRALAEE